MQKFIRCKFLTLARHRLVRQLARHRLVRQWSPQATQSWTPGSHLFPGKCRLKEPKQGQWRGCSQSVKWNRRGETWTTWGWWPAARRYPWGSQRWRRFVLLLKKVYYKILNSIHKLLCKIQINQFLQIFENCRQFKGKVWTPWSAIEANRKVGDKSNYLFLLELPGVWSSCSSGFGGGKRSSIPAFPRFYLFYY